MMSQLHLFVNGYLMKKFSWDKLFHAFISQCENTTCKTSTHENLGFTVSGEHHQENSQTFIIMFANVSIQMVHN